MRALLIRKIRDQFNRHPLTSIPIEDALKMVREGKARQKNGTVFEEIEINDAAEQDTITQTYKTRDLVTETKTEKTVEGLRRRGRPPKAQKNEA